MSDRLNSILSKLVTSIEGVKDEKEMLLRLIIGLAVFLLLALFRKQISKAIVWLCTKTIARKSDVAQRALVDALSVPLSFLYLVFIFLPKLLRRAVKFAIPFCLSLNLV